MALPTIDDFKSQFRTVQSNRYQLVMPTITKDTTSPDLNMLCDAVSLPGKTMATTEYSDGRQQKKIPYTFMEDDVSITFIETENYGVRRYFESWMKLIVDTDKYVVGFKSDFVRDISISQLNRNEGNVIYTVKLINAFPTTISPVEFSNGASNDIVRLTATFAYDVYTVL